MHAKQSMTTGNLCFSMEFSQQLVGVLFPRKLLYYLILVYHRDGINSIIRLNKYGKAGIQLSAGRL